MSDFGTPFVSSTFSRVTNSLSRDVAMANLTRLQQEILRTQEQATSGKRINRPSDDPVGMTIALNYRRRIARNDQFIRNLQDAGGALDVADKALGDAQQIVNKARTILLREAQATADTRSASADEIDGLLVEAIDIANTRYGNRRLFAGSEGTRDPFAAVPGGVMYRGDDAPLAMNLTDGGASAVGVSGADAFGGLSAAIAGNTDIDPDLDVNTRLARLNGGRGVRLGSIAVGTGFGNLTAIDLRTAQDVGDVLNLINARSAVTNVSAALNAAGDGITLDSIPPGGNVLVQEVDGGATARDLGLPDLAAPAAAPVVGGDLDPTIAADTPLALLNGGAGLDLSGIVITNATSGQVLTATLGFAGLITVGDLLNAINLSGAGVRASINDAGTGVNLQTRVDGARLTVAENGGATAAQLGILSSIDRAKVVDLNNGFGVPFVDGDDIQIQRRDGTTFEVDLSGAVTVQDLVNAINNDPQNGGTVLAAVGAANNLVLTDLTGAAAANFEVRNFNDSRTATVLGIEQSVGAAVITGTDLNWAGDQSEGLFTALLRLRDALRADSTDGINDAGRLLDAAQDRLLSARGDVGSASARAELAKARFEDERATVTTLRSGVEDADLAEVATRFQQEQVTLQAALAVTARLLQSSLLEFLQ